MDYLDFLDKADAWEVSEAVDRILGIQPVRSDDPDPDRAKKDCRELAYRAIDAGTLPCVGRAKERRVNPRAFVLWAISKGYQAPAGLLTAVGVNQDETGRPHTVPAPHGADETATVVMLDTSNPTPQPSNGKRHVAWLRELLSAWPDIVKAHGATPGALKAMSWLKKNGPSDVFPRDQTDSYSLQWIDEAGNLQTVPQKTVQNRISECRKSGEIPG